MTTSNHKKICRYPAGSEMMHTRFFLLVTGQCFPCTARHGGQDCTYVALVVVSAAGKILCTKMVNLHKSGQSTVKKFHLDAFGIFSLSRGEGDGWQATKQLAVSSNSGCKIFAQLRSLFGPPRKLSLHVLTSGPLRLPAVFLFISFYICGRVCLRLLAGLVTVLVAVRKWSYYCLSGSF
jgi:hypothetical protein